MMRLCLLLALMTVAVGGEEITAIAIETSFGSCTGYCSTSVRIDASRITTFKTSKTNPTEYPEIQEEHAVDPSEFEELVELVGNIQQWKSVDPPVSCIDCSNQNVERIDVYTDAQPKYGVTFAYGETIPDYGSLVERVRAIRQRYFPSEESSA